MNDDGFELSGFQIPAQTVFQLGGGDVHGVMSPGFGALGFQSRRSISASSAIHAICRCPVPCTPRSAPATPAKTPASSCSPDWSRPASVPARAGKARRPAPGPALKPPHPPRDGLARNPGPAAGRFRAASRRRSPGRHAGRRRVACRYDLHPMTGARGDAGRPDEGWPGPHVRREAQPGISGIECRSAHESVVVLLTIS